jgi:dipeptidyl aminopeptidase/acylaminoacyl peptidase
VEISVSATIDQHGIYKSQPAVTKRYLNFALTKQGDQWRISSAPNLTVLIRPNFSVLFKAYQLYFFDKNHTTLVPDVRWFPSRTSTATHLVQSLLQGPQPWMKDALAWDFPEDTALNLDSVTVAEGEARVDLSSQAIAATRSQLRFMKAQIKATLLQIPSVTSLNLTINNSPQNIADLRANIPSAISSSPVTLNQSGLYGSNGQSVVSLGASGSRILAEASDFALNLTADRLALVSNGSLYRIDLKALDKSPKLLDSRVKLLTPEFDSRGYLWSVGSSVNSAWLAAGTQGFQSISTSSLTSAAIKAFSLSPDGARVAVLYSGPKPSLWVHAVIRDGAGQPTALGSGIKLESDFGKPISVQWADAISLAVLTMLDADSVRPTVVMLGGETKFYPVLASGRKMVANLATSSILVTRKDGTLVAFKSNSWVQIATDVRAVHLATLQ